MVRYKVSNKNIYGFKDKLLQTLMICVPLVMVLGLITAFVIAPLFYDRYVEKNTVPGGAAGSVSTEDTPVAASIADMERLTDGFTFQTTGTVLEYDDRRVGNASYHFITLESGEKVFARINMKALTKMEPGIYRLPVGVWREWTVPEELTIYSTITDATHYIDMYGGFTPILSLSSYGYALANKVLVLSFILSVLAFRIIGVRRWRFAPALMASRDPLLPRNDLECWCAATFAIWSHSFDGMEGFPLITGSRGTRKQVKSFRDSLAEQWDIHNKQEGLQTVHELTDTWSGELNTREAGWDLCRATQLLGMMYLVRMLSRDELDQEFSRAGRVIQRSFPSWDAMVESYLEGFRAWVARTGRNAESNLAFRRGIYERLKRQSLSPYSIPWDTELNLVPGVGGGERTFTKRLLSSYRGDF